MIEINYSIEYPKSAETVFGAVADLPNLPTWQQDVLEARLTSDELAAGAHVHQIRKVMGRRTEVDLTVAEFLPGELLTMRTGEGTKPAIMQSYHVVPGGDGTTSRLDFRLEIDGVPRMAEHLAKVQLGKQVPQMFANLGQVLAD